MFYIPQKIADNEDLQDFDFENIKKYVDRVYGFCAKYRIKPNEIEELESNIQSKIFQSKKKQTYPF